MNRLFWWALALTVILGLLLLERRIGPVWPALSRPGSVLSGGPSGRAPSPAGPESGVASSPSQATPSRLPIDPAPAGNAGSGYPVRAAFYYPWFPEAWTQSGMFPYTHYSPTLGFYDSGAAGVIQQHIAAMQYGRIDAGILSWWGQGHHTDGRVAPILAATAGSGFQWAVYHEGEGQGDPGVAEIAADLAYLRDQHSHDPSYWRLDGRFVVFVYADAGDGCDMADRWAQANTSDINAYLVLKVFAGYRNCSAQPQAWHQYAPAVAADSQAGFSYAISPGFWKVGESPRLERDLARWRQNIRDMMDSGAPLQLITTFNEWGEGTAVEAAAEWSSPSGYGQYLDALHSNGAGGGDDYLPQISTVPSNTPILVGAGDIATCSRLDDEATADLLDAIPGTVFTAGDNAYDAGTPEEFANCYGPSWGRHRLRTRPSPGNHEYRTSGAAGYFDYFGAAAGDPARGYYSYELGSWHVVVLNSNCGEVGGCQAGSAQEQWLRADLAAHPAACTVAYWHHPRFSSGRHGSHPWMQPIWQALYDHHVDVVLNGHDHHYERFARQRPDGQADPAHGIRQFVVGTGGKSHYTVGAPIANSEIANDDTFGVLRLTLLADAYQWRFIPVAGQSFTDSGSESCH